MHHRISAPLSRDISTSHVFNETLSLKTKTCRLQALRLTRSAAKHDHMSEPLSIKVAHFSELVEAATKDTGSCEASPLNATCRTRGTWPQLGEQVLRAEKQRSCNNERSHCPTVGDESPPVVVEQISDERSLEPSETPQQPGSHSHCGARQALHKLAPS